MGPSALGEGEGFPVRPTRNMSREEWGEYTLRWALLTCVQQCPGAAGYADERLRDMQRLPTKESDPRFTRGGRTL